MKRHCPGVAADGLGALSTLPLPALTCIWSFITAEQSMHLRQARATLSLHVQQRICTIRAMLDSHNHACVSISNKLHRLLCTAARDTAPDFITALHVKQGRIVDRNYSPPDQLPWRVLTSLTHIEELQFVGYSTATNVLLQLHSTSHLKRVR
jgi:hypothetical protein